MHPPSLDWIRQRRLASAAATVRWTNRRWLAPVRMPAKDLNASWSCFCFVLLKWVIFIMSFSFNFCPKWMNIFFSSCDEHDDRKVPKKFVKKLTSGNFIQLSPSAAFLNLLKPQASCTSKVIFYPVFIQFYQYVLSYITTTSYPMWKKNRVLLFFKLLL